MENINSLPETTRTTISRTIAANLSFIESQNDELDSLDPLQGCRGWPSSSRTVSRYFTRRGNRLPERRRGESLLNKWRCVQWYGYSEHLHCRSRTLQTDPKYP